jgi:catechol 2,3-dioxygenase-like lactoylglutathione lyase family enzyme
MNRLSLSLCLLLSAAILPAQTPATAPSPDLAGIAHVALRVQNLDASVGFYEKLGFVRAFALSKDGAVYEAFIKLNDRQFIEMYPATAQDPQIGFLHLCFEGKNLQAVHDYYVAKGLSPTDVHTAGAGNLLFSMHGPMTPTGPQNMEYTQYMPGSLHSKDAGAHLGAERISTHLISVDVAANDPVATTAFYTGMIGFKAVKFAGKTLLMLPAADESIAIVPTQPLGFKARITFEADTAKAAAALRARGVAFTSEKHELVANDPDGNQIVLRADTTNH